jgi:hypothetical protein
MGSPEVAEPCFAAAFSAAAAAAAATPPAAPVPSISVHNAPVPSSSEPVRSGCGTGVAVCTAWSAPRPIESD